MKRITTTSCYTLLLLLILSSYYISPSQTLNYDKLPRLYVGPSPFIENRIPILRHVNDNNGDGSEAMNTNNNNKNNNKMQTVLEVGSRIPMTPEQSHYLNKVLRIFKKKKKIRKNHDSIDDDDDAPKIRIFDGQNGEWLTKIVIQEGVEDEDDIHIHTKKRSRTRSSSLKNKKLILFAECLEQLRPQQRQSNNKNGEEGGGEPWIFFAPLHNKKRLSMMIEKCTELGTYFFFPMDTEFTSTTAISSIIQDGENDNEDEEDLMGDSSSSSMDILYGTTSKNNKKKSTKNQDDTINNSVIQKLNLIAVEASEQSERLTIPFVSPYSYYASSYNNNNNNNNDHPSPTSIFCLDEILAYWVNVQQQQQHQNNNRVLLICRERSNKNKKALPILKILEELQQQQQQQQPIKIAFMIGPEGGWSPYEEELFDKYCVQYPNLVKSVSLGSSIILRAETAAIVAMSSYALFCDATK